MYTNHYIFIGLMALLVGCNTKDHGNADQRLSTILEIHEKAVVNPDSFLIDLQHAQKLIQLGGISDSIIGENDFKIGRRYARRGDLDSAAIYFQSATDYIKAPITNNHQVTQFNFAWNIYHRLGKYGDCLALSRRYATLINEGSPHIWRTFTHFMDENVYRSTKDYENSIKNNAKRIEILEKAGDTIDIPHALLSQAESRYHLEDKKGAFAVLDGLVKKEKYLNTHDNRKLFGDYAKYLSEEKKYRQSLKYYLKSLDYKKKLTDNSRQRLIASNYSNIADIYIKLGDYNNATKYLDSVIALDINSVSRGLQKEVLTHQMTLSVLDKGKLENVVENLNAIFDFQDKSYEDKYKSELVALQKANENEKIILKEKQDAEIKSLKLQSRMQFTFLGIGLLGVIGYLFFRQRKLGFERQQLQMQQRLLRSQMNPHFTSNTLYSIQNLVKDTPEVAGKYLTKFSRLLRLVLENSMSNYVQLENELETLKKYLDLQQLRFESKFNYEFVLNGLEEDDLIFIPPMLIQPVVENSIEHGLLQTENGKITITLSKNGKYIECIVEDNGKGIGNNEDVHKNSASTQLINDFLRKTTKSGLEVLNKNDIDPKQSGVLVTFLIPYRLTDDD